MTAQELLDWLYERDLTLVIHGSRGVAVLYPADDPEQQFVAGPEIAATTMDAVTALMARWDIEEGDGSGIN